MAYPSTDMSLSSAGRTDASPFGLGVPSRLDVAETPPQGDVQEAPPPSSNIRQVQGQRFSETHSSGRDGAQLSEGTASRCGTTAPIKALLLALSFSRITFLISRPPRQKPNLFSKISILVERMRCTASYF